MPRSATGKKRVPVNADSLKNALRAIHNNHPDKRMSYREASKVFNVSLATLGREAKKYREEGEQNYKYSENYAVKQVFDDFEEQSLVKYIKDVARMQYGLTKKGVRKLAYRFAVANSKKYPETWDNDEIAGEEWLRGFLKRHNSELSTRKPDATSSSRASSFSRHNVDALFTNIEDVHKRHLDETGLSAVKSHSKIVTPKGEKQTGSVSRTECYLGLQQGLTEALGSAYPRALTPRNVPNGFKASEVFPLDCGVFLDEDFLCTYMIDRENQNSEKQTKPNSEATQTDFVKPGTSDLTNVRETETPNTQSLHESSELLLTSEIETQSTTLDEVHPCPKVKARKTTERVKRQGRAKVVIDTPEKDEIRRESERKRSKIDKSQQTAKQLNMTTNRRRKRSDHTKLKKP